MYWKFECSVRIIEQTPSEYIDCCITSNASLAFFHIDEHGITRSAVCSYNMDICQAHLYEIPVQSTWPLNIWRRDLSLLFFISYFSFTICVFSQFFIAPNVLNTFIFKKRIENFDSKSKRWISFFNHEPAVKFMYSFYGNWEYQTRVSVWKVNLWKKCLFESHLN